MPTVPECGSLSSEKSTPVGTRTIENFSSKIYALLKMPFTEDGVGWVMFDYELRNIVDLKLP